ncbi:MAG: GTPase, partial [Lachnospiraceae bacterium]
MSKGILIVISGFSGAGKGTIVKELVKSYDNYALSISMTTRKPREGEQNGREYFFTDRAGFEEKIAQNGL